MKYTPVLSKTVHYLVVTAIRAFSVRRLAVGSSVIVFLTLVIFMSWTPRLFVNTPYSTVVTAADGRLLGARVAKDGQWRFQPCDTIPEKYLSALLEYEDRNFYNHHGVNYLSIARALVQNLRNGRRVSGASTITMQTIRLDRRDQRNILQKLIEGFLALRLELHYSKREILTLYTSHAPYGGNVVGIKAASWRYLGNDGSDMSWAQAATLAVLPNMPARVHLQRNRNLLRDKRNRLLSRLREAGTITDTEYSLALEEPLIVEPHPLPSIAPHLVEYYHKKFRGKFTATSIDYNLQERLEEATTQCREELALQGINDLAVVIAEVSSGNIIAYCGNADMSATRQGQWVDIARAPRSSGSILKPLLYCAAMQEGIILEKTLLTDVPTDFNGFMPQNFDGACLGVVPADEALSLSLNIPNVHLLKEYGAGRFVTLLRRLGISTLTASPERYGLSLILGGAEVTLLDIVNCYARIVKQDGNSEINDSVAIYSMLEAMRNVVRPDGMDYTRINSMENIAWKTGTSYGARDGWAIGITPKYVVGVWVGNASGRGVAGLTGAATAGPVMFEAFNLLPPSGWFKEPAGQLVKVCKKSGHIASRECVDIEMCYVPANGLKSAQCPYCHTIPVSLDGKRRVVNGSEPSRLESFFILPPLNLYYYKRQHADYIDAPPAPNGKEEDIHIIYPADGAKIQLPNMDDGKLSTLVTTATHSITGSTLYWHLDDEYIGITSDIHKVTIAPSPGSHSLLVVDSSGNSALTTFTIN